MTRDVDGADLQPGDTVCQTYPDGSVDQHTIDHLRECPGGGLHRRIAYDSADEQTAGWRHTVADAGHFHILDVTEGQ